ncbi:hypothetical protein K1719_018540 [Acacia pycnantha]|nr:hypothetical protein K1719_018540 [Acacia pycnantha]
MNFHPAGELISNQVQDRTQCTPNGYYFIPVYDKIMSTLLGEKDTGLNVMNNIGGISTRCTLCIMQEHQIVQLALASDDHGLAWAKNVESKFDLHALKGNLSCYMGICGQNNGAAIDQRILQNKNPTSSTILKHAFLWTSKNWENDGRKRVGSLIWTRQCIDY